MKNIKFTAELNKALTWEQGESLFDQNSIISKPQLKKLIGSEERATGYKAMCN